MKETGGFLADEIFFGKTTLPLAVMVLLRLIGIAWEKVRWSRWHGTKKHHHNSYKGEERCLSYGKLPFSFRCSCEPLSPTRNIRAVPGLQLGLLPKKLLRV